MMKPLIVIAAVLSASVLLLPTVSQAAPFLA